MYIGPTTDIPLKASYDSLADTGPRVVGLAKVRQAVRKPMRQLNENDSPDLSLQFNVANNGVRSHGTSFDANDSSGFFRQFKIVGHQH